MKARPRTSSDQARIRRRFAEQTTEADRTDRDRAEVAEFATLLPSAGNPHLGADRRLHIKELLLEHVENSQPADARDRGSRRLRTRWAWGLAPVAAGAVAVALVGGVLNGGSADDPTVTATTTVASASGSASGLLAKIALVADARSVVPIRDDQFVYVDAKVTHTDIHISKDSRVTLHPVPLHRLQRWSSVDGKHYGWIIEENAPLPRQEDGETLLPLGENAILDEASYRYLESLPTDPDALLKTILSKVGTEATPGEGPSAYDKAFSVMGRWLQTTTPRDFSAALYRAAAKIPGVAVGEGADITGRSGVMISLTNGSGSTRTDWIFNRDTYAFLGMTETMLKDEDQIPAGTVLYGSAVTASGVTDAIRQIPKQ